MNYFAVQKSVTYHFQLALHLSGMLMTNVDRKGTLKLLEKWDFCSYDSCKQCDIVLEHLVTMIK